MKKIICIIVALSMFLGNVIVVRAADAAARNISVFRVEGENVKLSRGDARTTTPRDGQRLSAGNIITTGLNSTVHIQMDQDSILQMSASSQVAVSSSGNQLVLSLQSGSALVNVTEHTPGNTTQTRVGNVGLTVRGTMYTMGVQDERFSLVMLTGYGEVEGVILNAGQMMFVYDEFRAGVRAFDSDTGYFTILEELILHELDLFTLQVMYAHSDYLLEAGTLTPAMLEALPSYIHERVREALEAVYDVPVYIPLSVVVPAPTLTPGEGGTTQLLPTPLPSPIPTEPPETTPQQPPTVEPPYEPWFPEPPYEPSPAPTAPPVCTCPPGCTMPCPPSCPGAPYCQCPPEVVPPGSSPDNPILIASQTDLYYAFISSPCINGWAGVHFALSGSFAFSAHWRYVIGGNPDNPANPIPFRGVFNGNGHTINFLNIWGTNDLYVGLFAIVGSGGIVKNFDIVSSLHGDVFGAVVGGVAGAVQGGGLIFGVTVFDGSVQTGPNALALGGIAGRVYPGGRLENVTVSNVAFSGGTPGVTFRGLIVGILEGDVYNWAVPSEAWNTLDNVVGDLRFSGTIVPDPALHGFMGFALPSGFMGLAGSKDDDDEYCDEDSEDECECGYKEECECDESVKEEDDYEPGKNDDEDNDESGKDGDNCDAAAKDDDDDDDSESGECDDEDDVSVKDDDDESAKNDDNDYDDDAPAKDDDDEPVKEEDDDYDGEPEDDDDDDEFDDYYDYGYDPDPEPPRDDGLSFLEDDFDL